MAGIDLLRSIIACLALLLALALPATAKPIPALADLEGAWMRYLTRASQAVPTQRFPFADCFERAATAHGVPLTLLLAVARGESDFDPRARSEANAWGLMQIQWPGTAKHLGVGRLADLLDPCTNVDAGARYLRELLERFDGNLHLGLAAYNYGPSRIEGHRAQIPKGAAWYSGYIYRHLNYVLGEGGFATAAAPRQYTDERQREVLVFAQPYRAEAFVQAVEAQTTGVRLAWFDRGQGRYQVVLLHRDEAELTDGRRLLQRFGIRI